MSTAATAELNRRRSQRASPPQMREVTGPLSLALVAPVSRRPSRLRLLSGCKGGWPPGVTATSRRLPPHMRVRAQTRAKRGAGREKRTPRGVAARRQTVSVSPRPEPEHTARENCTKLRRWAVSSLHWSCRRPPRRSLRLGRALRRRRPSLRRPQERLQYRPMQRRRHDPDRLHQPPIPNRHVHVILPFLALRRGLPSPQAATTTTTRLTRERSLKQPLPSGASSA